MYLQGILFEALQITSDILVNIVFSVQQLHQPFLSSTCIASNVPTDIHFLTGSLITHPLTKLYLVLVIHLFDVVPSPHSSNVWMNRRQCGAGAIGDSDSA